MTTVSTVTGDSERDITAVNINSNYLEITSVLGGIITKLSEAAVRRRLKGKAA
jgi:hypothetical protein